METPKELNWWIKATQHIRATLKPHIEEYNSKHSKKLSGTIHVSVAKSLKSLEKLSSTLSPQTGDIIKVYNELLSKELVDAPVIAPKEHIDASAPDIVPKERVNALAPDIVPKEITDDKLIKLSKLLTELFDGETTEIIINRKSRRGCWC